MRRGRGGARKVAMASSSRLTKRRHRSSCTNSRENHGEADGGVKLLQETIASRDEMEMKDLEFLAQNKRRRSDMLLHFCDPEEEGRESNRAGGRDEGEFEVEHGEVARESKDKSPTEIVSSNQRSLKCVIGAPVPRKTRSACAKRSPQGYPASGCHNQQQHFNSSETAQKTAESKIQNGKAIKLSGSVDDDMEMEEVAEVLFSLMKQSRQPDTARDSQQKPLLLDVKKSEHIQGDGDVEVCSWENNVEQGRKSEGSLLEIVQKDVNPVGLENAEILIEDDWLVKELEKDKSSSHMVNRSASESRNSVATKANQVAPLVECQTENLEIDFMVSPSESYSKLVQGRKRSPRDVDVKTIGRTKERMSEESMGKQQKFLIDMRSLNVPIDVTPLQLQRSYWNQEATEAAQITLSSVPVSKDLCRTMGYMQPRETLSFVGKSSGPFMSRKLSQDDWKRCATHYHIAEGITRFQQHNKMSCLSSASGSACSKVNDALSVKKDGIERPTQQANLRGNNLASRTSNLADSTSPRKNETAIEASSCLPDLTQRKQHLNHKVPNVSSSVTKKIVPAPAFHAGQYQMMGLTLNSECSRIPVSVSSVQTAPLSKNATGAGAVASSGLMMDPAMSFYKSHLVANEVPPFMTIIPANEYAFSVPSPVGSSASFKGVNGHTMPHFNGFMYQPEMFYPPLPLSQQPHRQTPILPSGQTTGTRLSHLSSCKQPQQQQHEPNVGGHNLLPSSNVNSQFPLMQHMQSSHQSCKSEVEVPDKKPSVANNGSAYSQHGLPPFQQVNFTMLPMVSGNANPKKVETREPNQEPKVGVEHPMSQPFSMSYSPFGAIKGASGINFSFPTQKLAFFPSLPEVAHQRYFIPSTGDEINRNYKAGAKVGIDFRVADSSRKSVTGKPSSYMNHLPAFSKAILHDQKDMLKELGISDSSAKTRSFNAASDGNPQNHHGRLQQQHAQGIWTDAPAMNGQPSAAMSTNVSYSPVLISHPVNWNSSDRMPIPRSTSTVPTLTKNPTNQVISSHCLTQHPYGGNNVKSVAVQGSDMPIMRSPSPMSSQSSSRGIKSGSAVASPTG